MSAGQWFTSPDGVRWHFDAGSMALDFASTGDVGTGTTRDMLRSTVDLVEWLSERFENLDSRAATDRDLADALALRSAISRLAVAVADGHPLGPDAVDTVNLFAATPDVPPVLAGGRRRAGAARLRVSQAMSSVARDAVQTLSPASGFRIRRCEAEDCRMVFHDESRTNSRRWCSMQRCGNRAKVRAHRERQKESATAAELASFS
ncbi:MAG TPA: CGNR zinc finger domain-containing protein [Pseudolysinimonas sp.]|nr:CGNR zinc finger domain-containing protein [Pseudolysinimonas sp.]